MQELKKRGYRFTKLRKKLLDIFLEHGTPLSSAALQDFVAAADIKANKTTIYRELDALEKEGIVHYVRLGDAVRRYELTPQTHHHHIVCLSCKKVLDIPMDEAAEERRIEKTVGKKFTITGHSLEWYGLCATCAKAKKL